MKKTLFLIFITTLLAVGCSQNAQDSTLPANNIQPVLPGEGPPDSENASPSKKELSPVTEVTKTEGPDCYGDEIHPVGQSIAELYEAQTYYTEVMIWFCNGFQFEDIITALETETDSAYTAEELLAALEYGLTWEEIWVETGLIGN